MVKHMEGGRCRSGMNWRKTDTLLRFERRREALIELGFLPAGAEESRKIAEIGNLAELVGYINNMAGVWEEGGG